MGSFGRKLKRGGGHMQADAALDRKHLLDYNQANMRAALQVWTSEGNDARDVVVMIVDPRDPIGRDFMLAVAPGDQSKADAVERSGQIPTLTACISRDMGVEGFRESQPNIARKLLERPPEGHFWACVISAGGALLAAPELISGEGARGNA